MLVLLLSLPLLAQALISSRVPSGRTSAPLRVVVDGSVPGQLPPTGFFDPLGLSRGIEEPRFRKYQEAELKHGRVAMLAALGFLVAESFHPLWAGKVSGAAIYHFQVRGLASGLSLRTRMD